MADNIQSGNLFMMCRTLNKHALTVLPDGFHSRRIRPDELDIWKRMHFDDESAAVEYYGYMSEYFERVYAPRAADFFARCIFVCDMDGAPVGTCFAWKAYGEIPTIHWYKVIKRYEDIGIGRALLSEVMNETEYPVYLHTHPGSYRAIKLYSDFGFSLLLDPMIGHRRNDIELALPYLKERMPAVFYGNLRYEYAPVDFIRKLSKFNTDEF